jgi:hypothetical protein
MTFPPNTTALDACVDMTAAHQKLTALGFDTIIRYASHSWKGIKVAEAKSMADHKLKLSLVFESTAQRALGGAVAGTIDGEAAVAFAATVGMAPNNGSVLFASTDFDVTASHAAAVQAYVQAFAKASPGYGVGLYGNGFINDMLFAAKLIQVRWITQSMGFTGSKESLAAGRFEIAQRLPAKMLGLDVDPDSLRVAGADIGARVPWAPAPTLAPAAAAGESLVGRVVDAVKHIV